MATSIERPSLPPERLAAARKKLGLTEAAIAQQTGLSVSAYCDLEAYPDELFTSISVAGLSLLCTHLKVQPRWLLLGDDDSSPKEGFIDFPDLSGRLRARMASESLTVKEFNDRVGWELRDVLIDPQTLWNFNIDGLRDLCAVVGIDWVQVLPDICE